MFQRINTTPTLFAFLFKQCMYGVNIQWSG